MPVSDLVSHVWSQRGVRVLACLCVMIDTMCIGQYPAI